jgi:hypothetical protein
MNNAIKLLTLGLILLPLPALADNVPAKPDAAKPAGELHGFDKYWDKIAEGKEFITKEQWMANAEKRFKEIDANGDDKISKEEMKTYDDKMFQQRKAQWSQYRKNKQQQKQDPGKGD